VGLLLTCYQALQSRSLLRAVFEEPRFLQNGHCRAKSLEPDCLRATPSEESHSLQTRTLGRPLRSAEKWLRPCSERCLISTFIDASSMSFSSGADYSVQRRKGVSMNLIRSQYASRQPGGFISILTQKLLTHSRPNRGIFALLGCAIYNP